MNKKIIALLSVLCTIVSCQKRTSDNYFYNFDKRMINELVRCYERNDICLVEGMIFCYNISGSMSYLDPCELSVLYKEKKYNSMDYKTFLTLVLNRLIILDDIRGVQKFNLDRTVMSDYESKSFEEFVSIYCRKPTNDYSYKINSDLIHEQQLTVIYCLYLNNYLTTFGDEIGFYGAYKIDYLYRNKKYLE